MDRACPPAFAGASSANAGDDRGAASPVSATNKRPQGSQLQRFPHTTIDYIVAAGLVPA